MAHKNHWPELSFSPYLLNEIRRIISIQPKMELWTEADFKKEQEGITNAGNRKNVQYLVMRIATSKELSTKEEGNENYELSKKSRYSVVETHAR